MILQQEDRKFKYLTWYVCISLCVTQNLDWHFDFSILLCIPIAT